MVYDGNHSVRMIMARVVTTLYYSEGVGLGVRSLLPRSEQEEVFQQVTKMLHKAYLVPVGGTYCVV